MTLIVRLLHPCQGHHRLNVHSATCRFVRVDFLRLAILLILNSLRLAACGNPLVQCVAAIKKLRLNFLAFLSKAAKKLRLPQAQA